MRVLPRGCPDQTAKRVEEADAGLLELGVVARDNDQVVDEGRGGDQAVFDRDCAPRRAKTCEQFCPSPVSASHGKQ